MGALCCSMQEVRPEKKIQTLERNDTESICVVVYVCVHVYMYISTN